jgi:hypothetical protein
VSIDTPVGACAVATRSSETLVAGFVSDSERVEPPYVTLVNPFVSAIVQEHVPDGGVIESTRTLMPPGMLATLSKKIGSVFAIVRTLALGSTTAART